jgi:hypothetical protein
VKLVLDRKVAIRKISNHRLSPLNHLSQAQQLGADAELLPLRGCHVYFEANPAVFQFEIDDPAISREPGRFADGQYPGWFLGTGAEVFHRRRTYKQNVAGARHLPHCNLTDGNWSAVDGVSLTASRNEFVIWSCPRTQITSGSSGFLNASVGHWMNLAKLNTKAAFTRYSSTVCAIALVASTAATTKTDLHPEVVRIIRLSKPEYDFS